MIRAKRGVNYINGTTSSPNDGKQSYVMDTTVKQGRRAPFEKYFNFPVADRLELVDVTIGQSDKKLNFGSPGDRAPNMPSGWTNYGVATYGDGKLNTNTVWAKDNSGVSGTINWFQPIGVQHIRHADLT